LSALIEAVRDEVRTVGLQQVIDDERFVPATEIPNPEGIQIIQPGVARPAVSVAVDAGINR